jgi:hypothetical protein
VPLVYLPVSAVEQELKISSSKALIVHTLDGDPDPLLLLIAMNREVAHVMNGTIERDA